MSVHTGATPSPISIRAWRNAVMVMFALGGVTISTWGPRLPSIRASLHVDDGVIGIVIAGVTIGSIAGLASSSALLAVLGPRKAIPGVLVLVAIGIAAAGVGAGAGSLLAAVVGFLLVGYGIGALDVMANVQGSAVEREGRKTLLPFLHAAWSIGVIIGSAAGAAAAALGIGFTAQFVTEALVIAASALTAGRFLRDSVAPEVGVVTQPVGVRVRQWLHGWSDWRLLLIGLVMLGVELGEGTSNSWLTLAVRDGHHLSNAVAALFLTAFAVGETSARIFGGPVVDRIGRVATVRVTTAVGVLGVVLFITGTPVWVVLLGTVLWAVGVSMGFPLGMSAAAESGPNPAARLSVVASIGYLANLGGPPVIGFLSQGFGLLTAFWLVVLLLAVGFVAAGALRPRDGVKVSPAN